MNPQAWIAAATAGFVVGLSAAIWNHRKQLGEAQARQPAPPSFPHQFYRAVFRKDADLLQRMLEEPLEFGFKDADEHCLVNFLDLRFHRLHLRAMELLGEHSHPRWLQDFHALAIDPPPYLDPVDRSRLARTCVGRIAAIGSLEARRALVSLSQNADPAFREAARQELGRWPVQQGSRGIPCSDGSDWPVEVARWFEAWLSLERDGALTVVQWATDLARRDLLPTALLPLLFDPSPDGIDMDRQLRVILDELQFPFPPSPESMTLHLEQALLHSYLRGERTALEVLMEAMGLHARFRHRLERSMVWYDIEETLSLADREESLSVDRQESLVAEQFRRWFLVPDSGHHPES